MASFKTVRPSHAKRFICCALTILYIMVGQSIASISNLGGILTLALQASVNMLRIGYIGTGPYDIYYIKTHRHNNSHTLPPLPPGPNAHT